MQLKKLIKDLGISVINKCKWCVVTIHKVLSYSSVSNVIAIVALLIAYNSLKIANKSLNTSLGVDTFVNKSNELISKGSLIIEKSSLQIDRLTSLNENLTRLLNSSNDLQSNFNNDFRIRRKGEINKFLATLYAMDKVASGYRVAKQSNDLSRFVNANNRMYLLDREKDIMDKELANTVLMVDTNMNTRFFNLYYIISQEQMTNKYNYDFGELKDFKGAEKRFENAMELLDTTVVFLFQGTERQLEIVDRMGLKI